MFFVKRCASPKTMTTVSLAFLVSALMMQLFIEPNVHLSHTSLLALHAIKGFLIGVSLAIGVSSLVQRRRNGASES